MLGTNSFGHFMSLFLADIGSRSPGRSLREQLPRLDMLLFRGKPHSTKSGGDYAFSCSARSRGYDNGAVS